MKKLLVLILILLFTSCAEAQVKIQDLTEDVNPDASSDISVSVKNFATTPVNYKVRWGNVTKLTGWQKSGTTISPVTSTDNVVTSGNITASAFYGDGSHLTGITSGGGGGSGTVGVVSVATANGFAGSVANATTSPAITLSTPLNGMLLGNGTAMAVATSGVNYAPATSGTSIVKGNGSGGFTNTVSGTDYAPATSGSSILYGNGSGGFSNVTIGSNLTFSAGTLSAAGGGGGGTPGGSNTQLQYNAASAFGGITGATTDGTTLTLVAPVLGAATATTINKVSITAPASSATLAIADGKTLTVSNNATVSGTNTGDQTITLSGDISGSGTGAITTAIGSTKVTNAMLAGSIAASKLIGSDITTLGTIATGVWNGTTLAYNYGGTGLTAATAHNTMVGSGIGWASKALPNCLDSAGQHLNFDTSTDSYTCGTTSATSVSAGGSDTQVQFNDGGTTLAGATALLYNKTNTASSGVQSAFTISPTINQSSTAGYNGLYVNATETATGSGVNNLANFAIAGTSKASISDTGAVTGASYTTTSTSAGSLELDEAAANGSNFLKLSAAASRSGDATVILDGTDGTTITLPSVTGTLRNLAPRSNTTTSSATPSINVDTTDIFTITALAAAITSMTSGLSGTPTNGQKLIIRFKDDGTARAITWGASFASRGATLPSTTVLGKYMYVGLIYNSTATIWDCISVIQEQ